MIFPFILCEHTHTVHTPHSTHATHTVHATRHTHRARHTPHTLHSQTHTQLTQNIQNTHTQQHNTTDTHNQTHTVKQTQTNKTHKYFRGETENQASIFSVVSSEMCTVQGNRASFAPYSTLRARLWTDNEYPASCFSFGRLDSYRDWESCQMFHLLDHILGVLFSSASETPIVASKSFAASQLFHDIWLLICGKLGIAFHA